MKYVLLTLMLGLMLPLEAHAICFKNSIPGPCNDNDRTVQMVNTPSNNVLYYGKDQFTGSPWKMIERTSGDRTIYTGTANGQSWTIVQHAVGNQVNYSGIAANGKRFSYTCSPSRCANYINPTSIKTRPNPPPEPIKSKNKYQVITVDPMQWVNAGVLIGN